MPVPIVAFILALFLKQVPLRGTARETASDVGEGFGMPESSDANQQLQRAIARLIQHKGRTELPRVRAGSGAAFDTADAWVVGQFYLRSRLGRDVGVEEIARRYHLPPAVLEPACDNAVRHGYLHAHGDQFNLTPAGEEEMGKIVAAMKAWLAAELADWEADDQELATALGDLATTFVEQEPELSREPVLALAGGPAGR